MTCLTNNAPAEAGPVQPILTSQDTQLIIDRLDLDQSAAKVVSLLLTDFEQQWRDAFKTLQNNLSIKNADQVPLASLDAIRSFCATQNECRENLRQSIELLLDEGSRHLWNHANDEIWVRKRLNKAQLPGENVNLYVIVNRVEERFGFTRSEVTRELLSKWESTIASLLKKREPYDIEGATRFRNFIMGGDVESGYEYLNEWVLISKSIREQTKQFTADICNSFPHNARAYCNNLYQTLAQTYQIPNHRYNEFLEKIKSDASIDDHIKHDAKNFHDNWIASMRPIVLRRRHIDSQIDVARRLSQVKKKTGRHDPLRQLETELLENVLEIRIAQQKHLYELCDLVGNEQCNTSPK